MLDHILSVARLAATRRASLPVALAMLAACSDDAPRSDGPTSPIPAPATARGGNGDNNGRIVFQSSRDGSPDIYSMNPDGTGITRLTTTPSREFTPSLSPDGKRVLFTSDRDDPSLEIYVMNVDGSGVTRLTFNPGIDLDPVWSKDGKTVAFASTRDAADPTESIGYASRTEIYAMNADGSGVTRLTNHEGQDRFPSWSADGKQIAFASDRDTPGTGLDVYRMNADGTQVTRVTSLAVSPDDLIYPSWSPGGKRIAFSAGDDVFVVNVDGTELTQLTSGPMPDRLPAWVDGAKRLVFTSFRDGNAEIYVMNSDGTGVTRLTNHPFFDAFPSGQR